MNPVRPRVQARSQSGTSLVEVLVALLVTAIGVLSVITLQLVATRNNIDATQRLNGTHLAHSLLEHLRSNASRSALTAYVNGAAPFLGRGQLGTTIPSPSCTPGDACSPAERAALDLWLWERMLDGVTEQFVGAAEPEAGGLFLATACVLPPPSGAGSGGVYTVEIAFRGSQPLPDNPGVTCGQDATMNGARLYGDNDEYRRTMRVQAYITPLVP